MSCAARARDDLLSSDGTSVFFLPSDWRFWAGSYGFVLHCAFIFYMMNNVENDKSDELVFNEGFCPINLCLNFTDSIVSKKHFEVQ